jgi:hypothetical protein
MSRLDDLERRLRALEQEQAQMPLWSSAYGIPENATDFKVPLADFDSTPAVGQPWFYNGSTWQKASAAALETSEGVLLVTEVGTEQATLVRHQLGNQDVVIGGGSTYYLQDTAGTTGTTPGTYKLPVAYGSGDQLADIAIPIVPDEADSEANRPATVLGLGADPAASSFSISVDIGNDGDPYPDDFRFTIKGTFSTNSSWPGPPPIAVPSHNESVIGHYEMVVRVAREQGGSNWIPRGLLSLKWRHYTNPLTQEMYLAEAYDYEVVVSSAGVGEANSWEVLGPTNGGGNGTLESITVTVSDGTEDPDEPPTLELAFSHNSYDDGSYLRGINATANVMVEID